MSPKNLLCQILGPKLLVLLRRDDSVIDEISILKLRMLSSSMTELVVDLIINGLLGSDSKNDSSATWIGLRPCWAPKCRCIKKVHHSQEWSIINIYLFGAKTPSKDRDPRLFVGA